MSESDRIEIPRPDPDLRVVPAVSALHMVGVTKSFTDEGGHARDVLRGVDLQVPPGRVVAIVGRSGSGKSTLLHLAAGIETPDTGTIRLGGRDLGVESEHARTELRRSAVGIVFQFFQLLPHLSVGDNVALPQWIAGAAPADYEDRLRDLLLRVDLAGREKQNVQTLSGGEMQRVALCRALLSRPQLLLADEPTGNLDDETGRAVMDLLLRLAREEGSALVLVTHSRELASRADEVLVLQDGRLAAR